MFYSALSFNQNIGNWNVANVTNMEYMLGLSGLSIANYDALLKGWSSQPVHTGLTLDAEGLKYSTAETERSALVTSKGWTITGDQLDCTITDVVTEFRKTTPLYPNP